MMTAKSILLSWLLLASAAVAQTQPRSRLEGSGPSAATSLSASATGTDLTLTPGPLKVGASGISTDGGVTFTDGAGANPIRATSVAGVLALTGGGGLSFDTATDRITWAGGNYVDQESATGSLMSSAGFRALIASGGVALQAATGAKVCIGSTATACTSTLTGVGMAQTDQSADCDNAATGNAGSGKVCIGAGQGSMVLTNSAILTTSILLLTNVSDDSTCLSGNSTVAAGSATIGCVGAATATANTVMSFVVFNP